MIRLERIVAAMGFSACVLACSSDSRNEPSPGQMCRDLAQTCEGLGLSVLDECQAIGERGIDEPKHEDQCFVFYDSCMDECRFVALWGVPEADSGGADSGSADSGGADSGSTDSGGADMGSTDAASLDAVSTDASALR